MDWYWGVLKVAAQIQYQEHGIVLKQISCACGSSCAPHPHPVYVGGSRTCAFSSLADLIGRPKTTCMVAIIRLLD